MNRKIAEFQEGVARRAAARAADPTWAWQRLARGLRSWEGIKAAAAGAVPSPWGALVALMIGSFVKSIVEQFAQVGRRAGRSGWVAGGVCGAASYKPAVHYCCACGGKPGGG